MAALLLVANALLFFRLTSKILPLGFMLNFDADINKMMAPKKCLFHGKLMEKLFIGLPQKKISCRTQMFIMLTLG